jgi:hypothetical protein
MKVDIGTEAAQFPEKEHINGIFLALHVSTHYSSKDTHEACKDDLAEVKKYL